jgi:hypothetical protein
VRRPGTAQGVDAFGKRRTRQRAPLPVASGQRFTADRMHGCAPGAGGPEGERNGNYRHGLYTKETRMRLRAMRDLTREVKELTQKH